MVSLVFKSRTLQESRNTKRVLIMTLIWFWVHALLGARSVSICSLRSRSFFHSMHVLAHVLVCSMVLECSRTLDNFFRTPKNPLNGIRLSQKNPFYSITKLWSQKPRAPLEIMSTKPINFKSFYGWNRHHMRSENLLFLFTILEELEEIDAITDLEQWIIWSKILSAFQRCPCFLNP